MSIVGAINCGQVSDLDRKIPFKSVRGLWKDLGISLFPEEIEDNQRDMWRNFPREEI